jgi:hypothetical protein
MQSKSTIASQNLKNSSVFKIDSMFISYTLGVTAGFFLKSLYDDGFFDRILSNLDSKEEKQLDNSKKQ